MENLNNKEFVLKEVRKNGYLLKNVSEKLKIDLDVVMEATKNNICFKRIQK
jgi:hypothetical protein